jgi:hypothetical protein
VDERAGRQRGALTDNMPALEPKPVAEAAEADDEDLEATPPG